MRIMAGMMTQPSPGISCDTNETCYQAEVGRNGISSVVGRFSLRAEKYICCVAILISSIGREHSRSVPLNRHASYIVSQTGMPPTFHRHDVGLAVGGMIIKAGNHYSPSIIFMPIFWFPIAIAALSIADFLTAGIYIYGRRVTLTSCRIVRRLFSMCGEKIAMASAPCT